MAYIDVDKFAEKICNFQAIDEDCATKMIWLLRTFPAADVVEVKHGVWSKGTEPSGSVYAHCSACNRKMNSYCYGYAHCPLCGAKMDGGKAE